MPQYMKYRATKIGSPVIRHVAQIILNSYIKKDLSITQLKKLQPFSIWYEDSKKKWESSKIALNNIEKHLIEHGKFDPNAFGLAELKCGWLDGDVDISLPQHIVGEDGYPIRFKLSLPLGPNFPICPELDREGVLYNSFQKSLSERIIKLHNRIVNHSSEFKEHDWLYDVIALISGCVSIVDITLNQLYLKAEYDPLPNWTYDKNILGERYNRRMNDKFQWVKLITGNCLSDINTEMKSFTTLKNIRNHTQHFDPPCFGFTLEDVVGWLNMVRDIGVLLLKIRKALGSPINNRIIDLLLIPKVEFEGVVTFNRPRAKHEETGYQTTIWNNENE